LSKDKTVYVVHCVDTEGPLYESLEATFQRLKDIFQLDFKTDIKTLKKLQKGEISLNGLEKTVQQVLDPKLLAYNDTWDKIDDMLYEILDDDFRNQFLDSNGDGWVYNWFCVDHVDYEVNPRRRDIGYHNIFDHYKQILDQTKSKNDGLHFHYHPHNFVKHAHINATHWWANSNSLYQVLCRRIIDRSWFPSANRPGFQVNRPDSHWFLEQFIPFDFGNMSYDSKSDIDDQYDVSNGHAGDWRRAPKSWTPYHPSHDDYQIKGDCRRWIARCLNVGTRFCIIREKDIRQAFKEASKSQPVVMCFANHDFRDITPDVENISKMVKKVSKDFSDVDFIYSEAIDAMRKANDIKKMPKCKLSLTLEQIKDFHLLTIESDTPIFGPQPFFALKTVTDHYIHDNLDFQIPNKKWTYIFDRDTINLNAVEKIGVAANNSYGVTSVAVIDVNSGKISKNYLNI